MKSASKIFYIIGLVSNILLLLFFTLGLIGISIALADPEFAKDLADQGVNLSVLQGIGLGTTIYAVSSNLIVLVLTIIVLKQESNKIIHIILLIAGILAWDLFYILGAIFGLIPEK